MPRHAQDSLLVTLGLLYIEENLIKPLLPNQKLVQWAIA